MKKVFSLFAASLLFMSMTPNVPIIEDEFSNTCMNHAFDVMDIADALGFSESEITCLGNMHYARCEGYEASVADCF